MKSLSKLLLFITLILSVLFITNCSKEILKEELNSEPTQTTLASPYTQRVVKLSDIPNVKSYLTTNLQEDMFNRTADEEAVFDVDNILEVLDTLNHTNYSFQFRYDDTPIGTFYNLIVGQTQEGENTTPFVVKYTWDEEHLDELLNNEFALFYGTMARHKYTDFFEEGYFSRTSVNCPPELNEVGDPIPCDFYGIDGSTSGGPASGSGPSGSSTGGDSGPDVSSLSSDCELDLVYTCYCQGELIGNHEHTEPIWQLDCPEMNNTRISNTSGRTIEDDCPDCPVSVPTGGGIATNIDLIFEARRALKSSLSLSGNALNWLMDSTNDQEVLSAYIFMNNNSEINSIAGITESIIQIIVDNTNINTFEEGLEEYLIINPNEFIDFLFIDEPDNPITNIIEFLECFDTTQPATLTVYVNEPVPGSGDTYDMTWSGAVVGHAFLSISQGNNTSVYGYYPAGDDYTNSPSALGEDGGEEFSASISTTISGSELDDIINHSINFNATYDLETSNCTDFIIDIGNLGGLNLPNAEGTWPGGGGSNPGTMGQFMNTLTPPSGVSTNTNGGNAPTTNKGC